MPTRSSSRRAPGDGPPPGDSSRSRSAGHIRLYAARLYAEAGRRAAHEMSAATRMPLVTLLSFLPGCVLSGCCMAGAWPPDQRPQGSRKVPVFVDFSGIMFFRGLSRGSARRRKNGRASVLEPTISLCAVFVSVDSR